MSKTLDMNTLLLGLLKPVLAQLEPELLAEVKVLLDELVKYVEGLK